LHIIDIIENVLQNLRYTDHIVPSIFIHKLILCLSKYFFPLQLP